MARVLVLLAHPALEKSRVNRRLIAGLRDLAGITIHDLYEVYPELVIDAKAEQALLLAHDAIIIQHPFFWYSTPAIVKEWQDIVLEHGWAYGSQGTQLRGKIWLHALSTGAPVEAYSAAGFNRFTVRQLLTPLELTAGLCGMRYLAPFVVHGAHRLGGDPDIGPYVLRYQRLVEALRDDRLDLARAALAEEINELC